MSETSTEKTPLPAAPDHDVEMRDYIEDVDDLLCDPYTIPAEDTVAWNLHFGARLMFTDDLERGDAGHGLHYMLNTGCDWPKSGHASKTVTPHQLRRFAEDLLMLARRAEERTGEVETRTTQIR